MNLGTCQDNIKAQVFVKLQDDTFCLQVIDATEIKQNDAFCLKISDTSGINKFLR